MIWVYPPHNWKSSAGKTFIYGSCNPKAKLFVSSDEYLIPEKVNVHQNGNFAKSIKLPNIVNNIKLIQITKNKKTILNRRVYIQNKIRTKTLNKKTLILKPTHLHPHTPKHKVIVIDPGHGGKEHGTHSPKGIPEKVFNLQIAKLLSHKLISSQARRHKTHLTRDKDKFASLKQRVNFAKKKKATILISIHHNALPDSKDPLKYRGLEIYYTHESSKPLAKALLKSISKEAKLKSRGVFKRDLALTRPAFYKAVLIECGYLIHPEESEYITKKSTQEKIVRGIVKALA